MAKTKRVAIPQSIRFEVFKRDSFKCQYCGRSAPEVVLHVDHIKPVSKGGTNDITNLITACFDCNSGKSDRTLDDSSVVQKQRKQLEMLQERREQLEMMMEWQSSMDDIENKKVDIIIDHIKSKSGIIINNDKQRKEIFRAIKKFGFDIVLESSTIAALNCTDSDYIVGYLCAICKNKKTEEEKPYWGKLLYIRGILYNKFGTPKSSQTITALESWLPVVDIDDMQECAINSKSVKDLMDMLKELKQESLNE